ncbi:unnamed protein product [Withania somnifera]
MEATQFPADIITEILSRLPVKPLVRFKCVSKSWFSLISSTEFINTHLNLSSNKVDSQHVIIMDELVDESGDFELGYKECPVTSLFVDSVTEALDLDVDPSSQLYPTGSCNGLIFLSRDSSEFSLIWNPTIRKHKTLTMIKPKWKQYQYRCVFGFGYDELHNDYKVVVITYHYIICCSDDIDVKLYSLKSDSWTSVDYCDDTYFIRNCAYDCCETLFDRGSFVHGKLHWTTSTLGLDSKVFQNKNIIAFDLANEKWEKVEKPSYGIGETELRVSKLGNDLSVFCDYETTHIGAWVMKEYGVKESWMKMFTVRDGHKTGKNNQSENHTWC